MSRRSRANINIGFEGLRPDKQSGWRTVLDLDFKRNCWDAGALTENAGALSNAQKDSVNVNQYHLYVRSAANMSWTQTADTGIVVDFNSTTGKNRLAIKVPYFPQLTQFEPQPKWPRIRVSASFSGLTISNSSDYIGVAVGGYYVNNANPKNPCVQAIYDVSSTSGDGVFKYHAMSTKGTWGSTGSGLNISGAVDADGAGNTSGVIVIEDCGQGMWACRGHDGDTNIKTGNTPDTFRAQTSGSGFMSRTSDQMFYRADAGGNDDYDGPYAMLWCNAGNTSGSQAVTWERMIVEMYI
tara:strand:+ start:829 stop:1716 length:888 start_codon:yes stop_codon:yes gene_type:complete